MDNFQIYILLSALGWFIIVGLPIALSLAICDKITNSEKSLTDNVLKLLVILGLCTILIGLAWWILIKEIAYKKSKKAIDSP